MSDPFELPAELTIYSALETRDALLAWATEQSTKAHASVKVSAANVASVDGSGLQLLAALGNMGLSWLAVDASPAFQEACQTMGLSQWIDPATRQDTGAPA